VCAVVRAVAADFFFNCWYLEIPSDNRIRYVPRFVHYHAQGFRLETFLNCYVGSGSRPPQLYSVSPDWSEYFLYMRGECNNIVIHLTFFVGAPHSMGIFYNFCLLTESFRNYEKRK
jgi:hypothetical protein